MKKSVIFEIWNRRDGRNTGDASMDVWERSVEQGENAVKESLIAGFQFDGRVYKEQIDQLSQIYYSYSELFRGLSENPQEDYEK